ncbi:hypothetical protein D9M69_605290 [compost metagenome]
MVGNADREEDTREHEGEACREDADPCQVFYQEDFEEAQLLVPEDIRPHVGEEDEPDDNQRNDNERRRQGTALWLESSGRGGAGRSGQTLYLIAWSIAVSIHLVFKDRLRSASRLGAGARISSFDPPRTRRLSLSATSGEGP